MLVNKATFVNPVLVGALRSLAKPLFCNVVTPIFKVLEKSEYVPEPTEPSLFTRGEGAVHPRWIRWFMIKHGLSHQMAMNIGTALYDHLMKEPLREVDPESPVPPVSLSDIALVSMAFVMDYRHRHGVGFHEAYAVGYNKLFYSLGSRGRFMMAVLGNDRGSISTIFPPDAVDNFVETQMAVGKR